MVKGISVIVISEGGKTHGSSRVRAANVFQYLEANIEQFSWKWIKRVSERPKSSWVEKTIFALDKRMRWLFRHFIILFSKESLFFCQRVCLDSFELFLLRKKCSPLIFDFDDAIYLDYRNRGEEFKLLKMLSQSDAVVVSTMELHTYCSKNGIDSVIIPSSVDTKSIFPHDKKGRDRLIVGWIGSGTNTVHVDMISQPLLEFIESGPFELHLMGAAKREWMNHPSIRILEWSENDEQEFLKTISIGIMPLIDNEYSMGKGGYKILLYMAAGIPCIASPIGINSRIIIDGENGFLAENQEDWTRSLQKLGNDHMLRTSMGVNGRILVEREYSLNKASERIYKILKRAKENAGVKWSERIKP